MNPPFHLSKSRFLRGVQCHKHLYLHLRRPDLEPEIDPEGQAVLDEGIRVGEFARTLFPGGLLIPHGEESLKKTGEALRSPAQSIFEGTFLYDDVYVKADILERSSESTAWDLIEVKSSQSLKEEHLWDLAVQAHVIKGSGLPVGRIILMYINSDCTHPNLHKLFSCADVTEEVTKLLPKIPLVLSEIKKMLQEDHPPKLDIGPHCHTPRECPFVQHCWQHVPTFSIFDLYRIPPEKAWELYRGGTLSITDCKPTGNDIASRMIEVEKTKRRFVDRAKIRETLAEWRWPLYFLDFETVNPAIPRFPGTHPREQVPFQFSCHIQKSRGTGLVHSGYLHPDDTDPRKALAESLFASIGDEGCVVAYNKKFEAECLVHLARAMPSFSTKVQSILRRLVDPLPVMRSAVYDRNFFGSFGLKSVALALLGSEGDYSSLEIQDGRMAQIYFAEMVKDTTPEERNLELREALIRYCAQDTLVLAGLLDWMLREIGEDLSEKQSSQAGEKL